MFYLKIFCDLKILFYLANFLDLGNHFLPKNPFFSTTSTLAENLRNLILSRNSTPTENSTSSRNSLFYKNFSAFTNLLSSSSLPFYFTFDFKE